MGTRISRRTFVVCSSLAISAMRFAAPQLSVAQTADDPLGLGPGTAVSDQASVEAATGFSRNVIESISLMDGSTANYFSQNMLNLYGGYDGAVAYFTQYAYPTEFFSAGNVLSYGSGHVSVDVNYAGGSTPGWYNTQRFYLLPLDVGGFALDFIQPLDPNVEGVNSVEVDVGVSDTGVVLSSQEVLSADVLVLNMINTSASVLSVGVYVLPEGVDPLAAQTQLVQEASAGVHAEQQSYEWLGGAPVGPAKPEGPGEHNYGFMVRPGKTYLLQQFVLGADNIFYPMEGQAFIMTVTISPDIGTPDPVK